MPLQIGIVGLPNVGKSTLFQALTKKQVDIANYPFATIDPNVGIVAVPDERLEKLAKLSHSKKIVPAYVEFVDIAGLVKGAAEGEGLGNKFLSHIYEVDAIVEVVRAFQDSSIIHVEGTPDPVRDIEFLETELLLKDLEILEMAVARLEREKKAGDKKSLERHAAVLRLLESVKTGALHKDAQSLTLARELSLLSAKPILYCFNAKDPSSAKAMEGEPAFIPPKENVIGLDIKEELELSGLSPEEAKELGALPRLGELIRACYKLLGLLTFLTTGEDETRAWTIPQGSKAPRAGRAIHSDFEEKFIRAMVISYEKFIEAGSWARARELGLIRTEGKDYAVAEGDIIEFKI